MNKLHQNIKTKNLEIAMYMFGNMQQQIDTAIMMPLNNNNNNSSTCNNKCSIPEWLNKEEP